ncbi:MAG: AsmA-like C-terminal region-containing protein, partial [Candidatus Binatia bacterium]
SNVELTTAVFTASKPNVKIVGRVGPLGTALKDLSLQGDVELVPIALAQLVRFAPVAAALPPDFSADGPLSLKAQVEGTVQDLALTGTVEANEGAIRLGDRFQKPQGTPFIISTNARVTSQMIALQKTTIQLHTLELTSSGKIDIGKTPSLDLKIDANPTTLAGWEDLLPLAKDYDLGGTLEVHAHLQGPVAKGQIPQINGSLTLNQVTAKAPQLPTPVTNLNATVAFTGQGADFKETSLRMGNSLVRLDGRVEKFTPFALDYRLSAPELHLADLQASTAAGKNATVLKEVKNEGRIRMDKSSLMYKGDLSSAQGVLSQVAYSNFHTAVSMEAQVVNIENASLQAFGGSVQGKGRYAFQQTPPEFSLTSQIRGVNLTELFRSTLTTAPQHIEGQANLDLALSGSGQGWEELKPSLHGQGRAEVSQGALLNVNIAEGVLSGVTGLPGLSLLVSPRVRDRYPEIFATQNTTFDKLYSTFTFNNSKMNIDDLQISAADYTMQGKGWVDFDQQLDLRAQLILSQKLSTDIADDVKGAKYIVNEQNRVEIPFALAGTLPQVRPQPDLAYVGRLLQRAALRRGAEELEKRVLRKILPSPQPSPPAEDESSTAAPPASQKPRQEDLKEQLLRKGLDKLFGR